MLDATATVEGARPGPADAAEAATRRVAVVLFNLGAPDGPAAVRPFLLNLFRDPAILRVPFFVRPFLARIIAGARVKPASENYALLGGKSPLLDLTKEQADALEAALNAMGDGIEARCFIAMRYWHPFSDAAVREVMAWKPDRVVLLPLYPQYSTTTSGSSLTAWREAAAQAGFAAETVTLCCYPTDPAYAQATAVSLACAWDSARAELAPEIGLRILFSAHGLPEVIVKGGDPYQFQVERTVAAVLAAWGRPGLDHAICYQSRATPQRWIGPSTEEEIERAAKDGVAVLVVPIAFVSEHSETLVELDVEYREVAHRAGVPGYFRAPAQNSDPGFIAALAALVRRAEAHGGGLCGDVDGAICPAQHQDCPHRPRQRPALR
ncbi:MAG: ferrochelatase [Proteobacteria bacterium]|nr:ferrochelatase [Pseudomonadota bacterium]